MYLSGFVGYFGWGLLLNRCGMRLERFCVLVDVLYTKVLFSFRDAGISNLPQDRLRAALHSAVSV
jgi:hypothetical protein